jgi:hypothetical protein
VPRLGVRGGLHFFCSYSLVISRRWVLGDGEAALVYFVAAMQSGGICRSCDFYVRGVPYFQSCNLPPDGLQSVSAHKMNTNEWR